MIDDGLWEGYHESRRCSRAHTHTHTHTHINVYIYIYTYINTWAWAVSPTDATAEMATLYTVASRCTPFAAIELNTCERKR